MVYVNFPPKRSHTYVPVCALLIHCLLSKQSFSLPATPLEREQQTANTNTDAKVVQAFESALALLGGP